MSPRTPVIFLLLVTACTSPSPALLGAQSTDVTIENSRFRVFHNPGASKVEAHRISFEPLPGLVSTLAKAHRAIEIATGCAVRSGSLYGDQAIIEAEVNC
jgi:hypothetical protein